MNLDPGSPYLPPVTPRTGFNVVKRQLLLLASIVPALIGLLSWILPVDLGLAGTLLRAYALAVVLLALLWLTVRALRVFLWRVSRRLAFSYLLIGLVPILLVFLLSAVAAYAMSGFYLGHLYRDAMYSLTYDLQTAGRRHLDHLAERRWRRSPEAIPIRFAYYLDGKRVAGDRRAPARWQRWWPAVTVEPGAADYASPAMVAAIDGSPTLMTGVVKGRYAVLAVFAGDLSRELAERCGVWVELTRADDPRLEGAAKLTLWSREVPILIRADPAREELAEFLHPGNENPGLLDRPALFWADVWRPFSDLASGSHAAEYVSVSLTTNLRTLQHTLISRSAEVGNWVYVLFVGLAFLLFDIFVVAALMAILMIFGMSRAVNRMTDATRRVQRGDFSARIEVQRQDQIGALQASFNEMAGNLETLVAQAAQKEILEKDLQIAQELQQSLLPDTLTAPAGLSFETYFEPSSAIGGDYYDILPMSCGRLAVAVADVSGHGISAGLRMAMVKSALQVLCEREDGPEEVLRHLHRLLRAGYEKSNQRGFVTATLALVDSERGELVVTNAGHPPTYLLRRGEVREIVLPSPPLGALEGDFGRATVELETGDIVVWLSDGLIEAQRPPGGRGGDQSAAEDFGYGRVVEALSGLDGDPAAVKESLLAAVAEHTGGLPPEDDRTLVVMAYRPVEPAATPSGSSEDGSPRVA